MENKYYVPEISEFHVGFEYEVLSLESDLQACVYIWEKEIFNTNSKIEGCKQTIDMGYIRVKYLDREDIESLGFRREFDKFRPVDIFCGHLPNDSEAISHVSYNFDSKILFIQNNQYEDNSTIFLGAIKNKSELKKLMQQLNIK